jgi:MEDS: MEthanogen/methylotroph, DcmR Sensory domain
MNLAAIPSEALRRRLEALGIPRARHEREALLDLLPGRPFDELDADTVAEMLLYLARRGLVELKSGSPALRVRWGECVRRSYGSRQELLALAVPYLCEGLQAFERCIWLPGGPLTPREARQAIEASPDMQHSPDQLDIVAAEDWCPETADWLRAERRALDEGYPGLRICGDALRIEVVPGMRIKALWTYPEHENAGHDG